MRKPGKLEILIRQIAVTRRFVPVFLLSLSLFLLTACQAPSSVSPKHLIDRGEYGAARVIIRNNMSRKKDERQYLLDRMKLGIVTLADGYPSAAQRTFEELYEVLRTQGINKDRTVQSVVFYEGVKIWKGEPYEQAMALFYYSVQQASLNRWDNARAAAGNSLFRLRDFRTENEKEKHKSIDAQDIAERALEHERQVAGRPKEGKPKNADEFINSGYALRESNFALGYIMNAIANHQLGRQQEAEDNLAVAAQINPQIKPLLQAIRLNRYNTILLVGFGNGPRKIAYGPDETLSRFHPVSPSDNRPLLVRIFPAGGAVPGTPPGRAYPIASDLNQMATDHMWNSMENVRIAKSQIGTGMMLAGAAIASHNDRKDRHDKALVGIGIMAAGALMRAGARADTRHCDVLPQRVYLVPLYLSDPTAQVELQVQGAPGSRIVLSGLGAPKSKLQAQLRYIQLVNSRNAAPPWAVSGQVYYDSDQIAVDGKAARSPYIVGGYSVAPPSDDVLDRYQGNLGNFTLAELNDLYREEGIKWTIEDEGGWADQHVLEGGKSLVAPLPGTVGFARLFGQLHQPHQARSSKVRALVVTPN